LAKEKRVWISETGHEFSSAADAWEMDTIYWKERAIKTEEIVKELNSEIRLLNEGLNKDQIGD